MRVAKSFPTTLKQDPLEHYLIDTEVGHSHENRQGTLLICDHGVQDKRSGPLKEAFNNIGASFDLWTHVVARKAWTIDDGDAWLC